MSKVYFILSLLALVTTGCAIGKGVRPAYTNGDVQVYEAKCNGMARTINDCYAQASTFCEGKKFKPVGQDATSTVVPVNNGFMPVNNRSLAFTCED